MGDFISAVRCLAFERNMKDFDVACGAHHRLALNSPPPRTTATWLSDTSLIAAALTTSLSERHRDALDISFSATKQISLGGLSPTSARKFLMSSVSGVPSSQELVAIRP